MPTPRELEKRHPEYERQVAQWRLTRDHYDAERLYDNMSRYVPQKVFGEKDQVYEERLRVTKYLPILAAVLDSVTGGVVRHEESTRRDWGPLEGSDMLSLLLQDADLQGTMWRNLQHRKLTDAMLYQCAYTLVDTTRTGRRAMSEADGRDAGNRPFVSLIPRTAVVNWRTDGAGRMVEALILESTDQRGNIFDDEDAAEVKTYLHITLSGWARYIVEMDDATGERVARTLGQGPWLDANGQPRPWLGRDGRTRLPLVTTRPRLRRYSAFELAQLANELLNINSELRWILRFGGLGQFLILPAEGDDFDDLVAKIKSEGVRAISEVHDNRGVARFIGPDMAVVDGLMSTLKDKLNMFWQAALFEFSDAAVERTATEIKSDFMASLGAFLANLASAGEESENEEMWLLAQAMGRNVDPAADVPRAEWPRQFDAEDAISVVTRMRDLFMGQNRSLVTTPEIDAELTLRAVDAAGISVGDMDDEALRNALLERAQGSTMAPAETDLQPDDSEEAS